MNGAPALLLDRRPTLAMQQPEGDVRLAGSRLRRRRQADGDVDKPEAHGSIPGCAHLQVKSYRGRPGFALPQLVPAVTFTPWPAPGRSRICGGTRSRPRIPTPRTCTRWTGNGSG